MAADLTDPDRNFLDQLVAEGRFSDRDDAIQAAVDCLRQAIKLDELIESRYAEVERGEVVAYDDRSLTARFEELRTRAHAAARPADAP